MLSDELRRLWEIRFKKILSLEKESLNFYSGILKNHKDFLADTKAKVVLASIMADEARHAQIADELLKMVQTKARKK